MRLNDCVVCIALARTRLPQIVATSTIFVCFYCVADWKKKKKEKKKKKRERVREMFTMQTYGKGKVKTFVCVCVMQKKFNPQMLHSATYRSTLERPVSYGHTPPYPTQFDLWYRAIRFNGKRLSCFTDNWPPTTHTHTQIV